MQPGLNGLRDELQSKGKISFDVKVVPRSAVTGFAGYMADGTLKIKLAAVPEKNRANQMLIEFLANEFHTLRDKVEVVSGATSTRKRVQVSI